MRENQYYSIEEVAKLLKSSLSDCVSLDTGRQTHITES